MIKFVQAVLLVLRIGPEKILRLQREASTDPLTGLLNRRGFEERLLVEKARSDRYGHSFLVAYLDLDNLKEINDTLGHNEGDRALISLAKTIKKSIRSNDFAGRLGGDEFVVVFVEVRGKEGILERLLAEVEGISSVGHYHYDGSEPISLDEIIHLAEREMRANKKGRKVGRD